MRATITVVLLSLAAATAPVRAAGPRIALTPIPSDPATMALAQKAIGKACRFDQNKIGPQVAGLSNLPRVGQGLEAEGFIFMRKNGGHRVAFLAREVGNRCTVVAVQALPPAARGEEFQQCEVANPDPMINTPISTGLGLRQGKGLITYLEADLKAKTLIPKAADDRRIRCSAFESGD